MKNILIVSYFFYPENTPRAFRTTELALELARTGYNVTVALPDKGYNYSNYAKKNNLSIVFYDSYPQVVKKGIFRKIISKLLFKMFDYPDIRLMYKVNFFLKAQDVFYDAIISVAYPHTIHFGIASLRKKLKQKSKVWIADCGDPFMGNPIVKRFFYFKYLEIFFCKRVDYITIPIKEGMVGYYEEFYNKIRIIPQGFKFDDLVLEEYVVNIIPTFIYAGSFYVGSRDPRPFLEYLTKVKVKFVFIIYTNNYDLIKGYKEILQEKLEIREFVDRSELLRQLSKGDFLVNFSNQESVQLPSKLIDYALTKRPILNIGCDSFALDMENFQSFLQGNYSKKVIIDDVDQYNIRNVAKEFSKLIYEN